MPDNSDSHAALLLLGLFTLIAIGLASIRPIRNRFAVAATSLLLLGGSALLFMAKADGYFVRFEKPETPLDFVKTHLLTTEAAFSAIAGIFLLVITYRLMLGPANTKPLLSRNETNRYGKVSRFLHWSTALMFIALLPKGVFMSGLPDGTALREPLYTIHKSLGMALLLLILARIGWHIVNHPPSLSTDLIRSNRIAAKSAHILLYVLMIGFPLTGYFMSSYAGKAIPLFYVDLPVWLEPAKDSAVPFGLLHKFGLPILFYLVFVAHVAGVIKHHFFDGHRDAIRRTSG